ncbi:MAG: DUF3048 domain-containing protein [Actinomycetota bacterium]
MRIRPLLATLLAVGLVAAGCSGDSDDDAEAGTDDAAVVTSTTEVQLLGTETDQSGAEENGAPPPTELAEVAAPFPLTGAAVGDAAAVDRPALAVKIDNAPSALPQAGINDADVVFEERVEGGLTRLLAIFHSQDTDEVGPVRSARSTDIPILATLVQPLFAWSGANAAFAELVRQSNVVDVGVEAAFDAYEARDDRPQPSHLFSSTEALYAAADGQGVAPRQMFRYRADDSFPPSAREIEGITIDYGATTVTFTWDAGAGGWLRTQDGEPHLDTDGEQVAPTNVVVRFVTYVDSGSVDSNGNPVPEAQLQGLGDAWFLVDGRLIEGQWDQRARALPAQYLALNGSFAQLDPGNTWVVLPDEGAVQVDEVG